MRTAVIILSHGSKNSRATNAMLRVVSDVKMLSGFELVEHAFLQYSSPNLSETIERCISRGAVRIAIVPFFMQSGSHVSEDIPALVEKARKQHPDIEIAVTEYAGAHPLMAQIVVDLVKKQSRTQGNRGHRTKSF